MRALPALLFDLDGTLVDSAQVIASAISIVAQDRGRAAVPVSEVRPLVSQGVAVLVGTSLGTSGDALADDISTFRTILASLKADREIIYPGVEAALTQFQANGYRMAVVTNKPFFLAKKLMEEIGLIDFFEIIVGGDTVSVSKPEPEPVLHALTALDAIGSAAWLIGDSAVDEKAAFAAGVKFMLFEEGYGAGECVAEMVHARFSSFDLLPALIARGGSGSSLELELEAL
jgi:phosphoglycolate phosphatase